MSIPSESKCRCTPDPICPYCGHEQSDFWEYTGEDGDCQCGNCERTFMYSRYTDVTYTTEPIIGPHKLSEYQIRDEAEDENSP